MSSTDPRPAYRSSLQWAAEVVGAVRPDQHSLPTPSSEFDVESLTGHLVATVIRARLIGEGADPRTAPLVVDTPADASWSALYADAADSAEAVWEDDGLLDTTMTAPWGQVPGRAALWMYANEVLVHAWDLAVSIGVGAEADADTAETVLGVVEHALPQSPRGGPIPFGPVVTSRAGAGPTERLANWSGHSATLGG